MVYYYIGYKYSRFCPVWVAVNCLFFLIVCTHELIGYSFWFQVSKDVQELEKQMNVLEDDYGNLLKFESHNRNYHLSTVSSRRRTLFRV